MQLCHISDTHTRHAKLTIPPVDVIIHSGDIGSRTNLKELHDFLEWFDKQPAKVKIFIGGNHDIHLDKNWHIKLKNEGKVIESIVAEQEYKDCMALINKYKVVYLNGKDYIYNGLKFWGSPYSPSFHRDRWAFNADKGPEIMKEWSKIPTDTDVLITHTPPYGTMDEVVDICNGTDMKDPHKGCEDLSKVIKKRLTNLKLHAYGHIHQQPGVMCKYISHKKTALLSNGAVLSHRGKQLITTPLIITL